MKNRVLMFVCLITALSATAPAFADDLPRRKPGLWETTMSSGLAQERPVVSQQCIDEKTDADLLKNAASGKDASCTQTAMKRLSKGWEFDSVCKQTDGTLTSHTTITGDFNSQYTMVMKGRWTPPLHGVSDFQSTINARHMGACPADMRPGDMKIEGMLMRADGMPTNLPPEQAEQMKKMMEQMQKQK